MENNDWDPFRLHRRLSPAWHALHSWSAVLCGISNTTEPTSRFIDCQWNWQHSLLLPESVIAFVLIDFHISTIEPCPLSLDNTCTSNIVTTAMSDIRMIYPTFTSNCKFISKRKLPSSRWLSFQAELIVWNKCFYLSSTSLQWSIVIINEFNIAFEHICVHLFHQHG